ncbi:MAG: ABC transporter ATP-binding protein [Clostridiales bacterium]|nr:ABC transporter ATP-binding protein [Clostridiales bacterium]
MKNLFASFGDSFKKALYLFRIQLSFGWEGVFTQFLYIFMLTVKKIIPVLLPKFIIDACTGKQLSAFVIVLISFSAFSWIVDSTIGITEWVQTVYNLKFAHYFKRRISAKAMTMDYKDLEDSEALDGLERAMDAAYYGLSDTLFSELFLHILLLIFLFFTVSTLNFPVALVTLAVVLLLYFINRKATEVNHDFEMQKSPLRRQREYAENCMLDFGTAKDIRANDAQNMFLSKFADASEAEIEVRKKQNRYNLGIGTLKTVLNALMIFGMYAYLIRSYSDGLVAISSFTVYLAALYEFYGAVEGLFGCLLSFRESAVNLAEIDGILGRTETITKDGKPTEESVRSIEFKNVTFTYPGQSEPAIRGLNLFIDAKDSTILVGENGAGKTTLIKLLLRLYDVDSGAILVNGTDIRELSYPEYIAHFAPVFQEVWLFAYSVKENIAFSDAADADKMREALDFAGIAEYIGKLPDGIDTFCTKNFDENGVNFSGGEQQKLTIARAVWRCADVVIMDEPNSALDALSESRLSENMRALAESKLLLLISHRLSMSRFCNHIVVLDNGEIIEEGTHTELMNKNGRYAEMYNMQSLQYK